ncbi:beta-alanine transporter-like [Dermacentor andersoni]|uniref:beta-alanine transporter-like n=1 Tax=Dermacentor andersoni TaxID=34620 RepID=UPI002155C8B9|nr:beta-alanine transporter-like [Dermacentor andersoni]
MGKDGVAYGEGLFQYMLAFSAFAAMVAFLTHAFSFRVTARTMSHWCRPPDHLSNLSDVTWKELAIPTDDKGVRSSCTMLDPPDTGDPSAVLVPCSSWNFDLEEYGNTIVSQWSLVCDRTWLVMLAVSLYAASPVVWLPMVGIAADTFGRKLVTYISVPVLVVAATVSSMTRSFALFVVLRVVVSVTSTSVLVLVCTILYEVSSPGRRLAYWLTSSALAYISLPLFFVTANSLKLSWDSVYRFLGALSCVLLVFFYTVDESPRWLLVKWKIHEAERVALRAARLNGAPMQECLGKLDTRGAELPKVEPGLKGKIFTICEPNLRTRTALLSFVWFVFTCTYNVVNLTRIIAPNILVSVINVLLVGPAQLLLYPSVLMLGVKRTAVIISVAFTLFALAIALLYREEQTLLLTILLVIMRVLIEMLSLLISIMSVATFPTSTRCWGACVLFAVGRLGSFTGLMYTNYEGDHRKDIVLCVIAAFMIFVCGAIECMPEDADDRSWKAFTAGNRSGASSRYYEYSTENLTRCHGGSVSVARKELSSTSTRDQDLSPPKTRGENTMLVYRDRACQLGLSLLEGWSGHAWYRWTQASREPELWTWAHGVLD